MRSPDEEHETLTLWCTPEEKRRLEAAAALLGMTVEEFVTTAAYEEAVRVAASRKAGGEAIRNAEPPAEAAACDPEKGHNLDHAIARGIADAEAGRVRDIEATRAALRDHFAGDS